MGYITPPGVSFGSIQRSFLTPPNSHLRQGLNPAMPAQPVGPSPGFRAVAYVCMVTSPNEVQLASKVCLHLPNAPLFLLIRRGQAFVKKKDTMTMIIYQLGVSGSRNSRQGARHGRASGWERATF